MNSYFKVGILLLFCVFSAGILSADVSLEMEVKKINACVDELESNLQKIKLTDSIGKIRKLASKTNEVIDRFKHDMEQLSKKNPELMRGKSSPKSVIKLLDRLGKLLPDMKIAVIKLKSFRTDPVISRCIHSLDTFFE